MLRFVPSGRSKRAELPDELASARDAVAQTENQTPWTRAGEAHPGHGWCRVLRLPRLVAFTEQDISRDQVELSASEWHSPKASCRTRNCCLIGATAHVDSSRAASVKEL